MPLHSFIYHSRNITTLLQRTLPTLSISQSSLLKSFSTPLLLRTISVQESIHCKKEGKFRLITECSLKRDTSERRDEHISSHSAFSPIHLFPPIPIHPFFCFPPSLLPTPLPCPSPYMTLDAKPAWIPVFWNPACTFYVLPNHHW